MQLRLPVQLGVPYKSLRAGVGEITEAWGEQNLYCASCTSRSLRRCPRNTAGVDFRCPECGDPYQLKSLAQPLPRRIPDAAYWVMRRLIRTGNAPSLLALHYSPYDWTIRNLLLVPRFAISLSAIRRRKPTLPKGRNKPCVLCDYALDRIPLDARISVVVEGRVAAVSEVRNQFRRLQRLKRQRWYNRGWTMDVLRAAHDLGKADFTLAEMYSRAEQLRRLHPENRHVEPKIRQQLQRLRELGFLEFVEPGHYRLKR